MSYSEKVTAESPGLAPDVETECLVEWAKAALVYELEILKKRITEARS